MYLTPRNVHGLMDMLGNKVGLTSKKKSSTLQPLPMYSTPSFSSDGARRTSGDDRGGGPNTEHGDVRESIR